MRCRGEHVGTFFVGDKADGAEFTQQDEEILVLFASRAAAAISNSRLHCAVAPARADLAKLVETSPVGVVVFDAASGGVTLANREALRIVEPIRTPGMPPEHLLDVVTYRRSDGREESLAETMVVCLVEDAVAVQGEEVELSVPDERSVRGRWST